MVNGDDSPCVSVEIPLSLSVCLSLCHRVARSLSVCGIMTKKEKERNKPTNYLSTDQQQGLSSTVFKHIMSTQTVFKKEKVSA